MYIPRDSYSYSRVNNVVSQSVGKVGGKEENEREGGRDERYQDRRKGRKGWKNEGTKSWLYLVLLCTLYEMTVDQTSHLHRSSRICIYRRHTGGRLVISAESRFMLTTIGTRHF